MYERWLQTPHYVVYRQLDCLLRYFKLENGRYQEQALSSGNPKIWFSDLKVGLGIWQGEFAGIEDTWLRWCDSQGNWLPTDTEREQQQREQAEAERDRQQQRAEQAEERAARLKAMLEELGIDPDKV